MSEEIVSWKQEEAASGPEFDPYRPPDARVEDPGLGDDLPLANPGVRLVARILDGLLTMLVIVPGALLLGVFKEDQFWIPGTIIGLAVLSFLGFQIFYLIRDGQTLAKKILAIRIVRSDGSRVSVGRLFVFRFLAVQAIGIIPILGALINIAGLCLIFRDDRRCLHDHIADTKVVLAGAGSSLGQDFSSESNP